MRVYVVVFFFCGHVFVSVCSCVRVVELMLFVHVCLSYCAFICVYACVLACVSTWGRVRLRNCVCG